MPDRLDPHLRLQMLRKQAGFRSQADLAHAAKVGYSTIQRLENKEKAEDVKLGPALKVARVLNVDVSEIYSGDDLPAGMDLYASTPPEWAQDLLSELHEMREEMRRYHEDCAS